MDVEVVGGVDGVKVTVAVGRRETVTLTVDPTSTRVSGGTSWATTVPSNLVSSSTRVVSS